MVRLASLFAVWSLAIAVGAAAATAAAAEGGKVHAEIQIAKVPDLAEPWGAPATEGDKAFRPLAAGKTGAVALAPWWGDSLRPAEGAAYRAEVVFKDAASSPIVVQAFAGLPGRYELHRIGGLADGQWKTALVPVPWDMVMRMPDKGKTEFAFSVPVGADIPFASIRIVDGDPAADELRWCEETRAWTARVQAEKRKVPKRGADENAVTPEALANAQAVPFVRPASRLIFDNSAPQAGEAGAPLRLKMALNEIEPAQFGVYANGADLKGVRVSLAPEGLKDANGAALDAAIDLFAAEYSVVKSGVLFPQRLWPAYPVDIPKGRSHLFWVNVETLDGKSRAGTYKGKIAIEAQGGKAELPVEVEVLPIRLLTMKEAKLYIGGCTTGLLPAHELKALVRHNHNSINLWYYGLEPKIVKKSKTEFDLDFTIPDDFMRHAAKAGVENFNYFLGGDPYSFPDTMQLERELYRRVFYDGTDLMAGRKELLQKMCQVPDRILPEVRPLYVQWAKKFMAHAEEAKWPEPLPTPFDEPAKWVQDQNSAELYYWKNKTGGETIKAIRKRDLDKTLKDLKDQGIEPEHLGKGGAGRWIKPHFKDSCAAIHEGWPKTRIYGSIHHADSGIVFLEDIEVFCTNAIHEDAKLGDKVRAGGPTKAFWQYSGCGDDRAPAEARYTFGFFFAAFDSRGSLCWAYNWGSRFDTTSGDQWLYAWTTPYSVVRAPFWEGMREAWDDRRYIETAKVLASKAGKDKEARDLLDSVYDAAVKTRTGGGRDTVSDFYARTKDPEALDTMRAKIADFIVKLRK